jgi:hypothetical protein
MTFVANLFNNILKAIPVLIAKVGTILLLIFTVGMAAGYALATMSITPLVFLIPLVAMFVMWYKLDEGVLVLLILSILIVFFPDLLDAALGAVL